MEGNQGGEAQQNVASIGARGASVNFSGFSNIVKLLPTGTFFMFQFLNPFFTNNGHCKTANKWLTSILLTVTGLVCFFSSFTDSYIGSDNRMHHGLVTCHGLWYPRPAEAIDLRSYKCRFGDWVHAGLSLIVFATLGLLDTDTIKCFFPGFETNRLVQVLPVIVAVISGLLFMAFPNRRHGIGYSTAVASNNISSELSQILRRNPNDNA
ncbi:hypothetical protein VNO77_05806 [Canavalia gladiata]|uniref:Uncharacterized protein n=1 Tax=Canavalia gladiata TaxID=3824 RepID=A0AAN9N123_CANGL